MIDDNIRNIQNVAQVPSLIASVISSLPPVDLLLYRLGANGFEVLREIYNDPFVYGAINSRKSGTLLSDWNIRGEGADEVLTWFTKLDIYSLIDKVLDAVFFGFQVFEINWSDDYKPVSVIQCNPTQFRLKQNELIFIGRGREETFPKQKFIYIALGQNYHEIYGTAVLSKIYYYWLFFKETTKMWVRFVEKFAIPFTEVEVSATDEEKVKIADSVSKAVSNAILVHDPTMEVRFVDVGQRDNSVFVNFIEHCKNAISQAILGHERGAQSIPGKLGNETIASEVRADLIASDKRLVENFFDTLIKNYWELHHDTEPPSFYFLPQEDLQMERAQRDQILSQIGVPFSPSYWKRQYNLADTDVMFKSNEESESASASKVLENQ